MRKSPLSFNYSVDGVIVPHGFTMSIYSEMKENTREITEVLQEACNKHVQVARAVLVAKSKLNVYKEENKTVQEIYEKNVNMHNIIDRKILHTEEGLCKYKSSTKDIMKKAEGISSSNDAVQWQQVKAKLIHTTEKAQQLKYQEMMEQYAKRISGNEEPPKEVKEISPQLMETIQKRKMKINDMKASLEKVLNHKRSARQVLADQVSKSERENLVLQKRNNALLLRLKRQLQESQYQCSHAQSCLMTLQHIFQQKSSKLSEERAKYSC